MRVSRKVCHDATIQIDNTQFETDSCLAGKRLEVRYEPEWLINQAKSLQLYDDGKRIGKAKQVRFYNNARVKRKFPGNRRKTEDKVISPLVEKNEIPPRNTISFTELLQGGTEDV